MNRVTAIATHHRRLVALTWLVLAIAGGRAAGSISDALSRSFDAPDRPAFQANRTIAERFGNGGQIAPIVLVVRTAGERRLTDRATRSVA